MDEQQQRPARYRDLFVARHEHEPNCAYCPICSAIGVVRTTRPEVLDHLAGAAREMLAALGLLLEEAEKRLAGIDGSHRGQDENTHAPPVRLIDAG